MKVETLTEEQFLNLADSATQEIFTNLTSMAVLKIENGMIIQNVSGEYLLISE
ncbi:MAG: hypothetical protein H9L35_05115 [Acinetobacter sp.]|uniref:hypothetical protein n=1 Tax=Acinetobacter sp. TaxID=472 RepID=UPI0019AF5801|nr:hypothetical protein [Acinetobacter sp.]MBC6675620.1 hypothetical protein [Acinetobacter sp.]